MAYGLQQDEPRGPFCMRVCVGVQDDGLNGIETYPEQVAIAAASAGHDVTLVVTSAAIAEAVRERTSAVGVRVVDAGLAARSAATVMAGRLSPDFHNYRVGVALARVIRREPKPFDVFHLNRPGLARWAAMFPGRVFVAGWFYPHLARQRVVDTWGHVRGGLPRRAAITAKALFHYMGDERGYRAATGVVACTERLAHQLRARGLNSIACPPPVELPLRDDDGGHLDDSELRLLVCSGDLSHPRKNLIDAVRALRALARPTRPVTLYAIGSKPGLLEAEAATLPSYARLEVLGTCSPSEVQAQMRQAHALLLPSLYEEWGYVAVEAMLCGTPAVTYPVYPFCEVAEEQLCIVADDITPEALAAAVERSLHAVRGRELSEACARRFSAGALGVRLTQIWRSPLESQSQLGPSPIPTREHSRAAGTMSPAE